MREQFHKFSRQFLPIDIGSLATGSTFNSKLSSLLKATRSVFASKSFLFQWPLWNAGASASLDGTAAHKVGHNSVLELTQQKIEMCVPAAIVVELEQVIYTVS